MAGRELVESFVGQRTEEMEMANDGESKRAWRKTRVMFVFGKDEANCEGGNEPYEEENYVAWEIRH